LPLNSKFCAAREEHLLDVNFECGKAGCATDRMTQTRVTMEQLDYGVRSGHKSVVYDAIRKNCSHWDAPVRQPLRGADEIGFHSRIFGGAPSRPNPSGMSAQNQG